ncbi:hypothetical protein N9368_03365 [Alphaproteobacteria bacterium]|mgnify:CR=1 FL=1|nr:hypothetical protein [Alphaproteobacteria bacterium]
MITLFRSRPKRGAPCARCQVIRLFVFAAVGTVLFGMTAGENVHYLKMVTAERAAAAIWIGGGILFVIKLTAWQFEKRAKKAAAIARAQDAQLAADPEKTDHTYSQ